MSARSGDWNLLGHDDDPVPGNWELIAESGSHFSSVAQTIAAQVDRLRSLAEDDEVLKGEYADGLRDSCRSAADDLERAHGRFHTIGSQLTSWAEPVRTARTRTADALADAENAQRAIERNPAPSPLVPGGPELTQAESDDRDDADRLHGNAVDALDQARSDCRTAMTPYNEAAEDVADAIRKASNDDMKDGKWDKFKNWVDDNADWLKKIADAISIIVTVVAIAALFFTPVGWAILAVGALAVIGLGIRVALAASGNGSWTDVALDVVGIATLGTGRIAASLAKLGRAGTLRAVAPVAGRAARVRAVASARQSLADAPLLRKPAVWLTRSNPVSRWVAGRTAYSTEKLAWLTKALPEVGPLQIIRSGGDEVAAAMRSELDDIVTRFGPGVIDGLHSGGTSVAQNAARVGAGADAVDTVFGDNSLYSPGLGPYNDLKNQWSYGPGGHLN